MPFPLSKFDASEKITEGIWTSETGQTSEMFIGSNGSVNEESRGLIYDHDGKLVSHSFGNTSVVEYTDKEALASLLKDGDVITQCFEGPLVKLWWDSEGNEHLSTTNKIDCTKSFWGNREERFGPLFYDNGGKIFSEYCHEHELKELTHHFMIMTPSLLVTSNVELNQNECIVVYLGSVNISGDYVEGILEGELHLFYRQEERNVFRDPLHISKRIVIPATTVYTEQHLDTIDTVLRFGYGVRYQITEEEKMRGVDINIITAYCGEPLIVRRGNSITKIVPSGYKRKCELLGNTPNIKLQVFRMMDYCRPKMAHVQKYFEEFDFLFYSPDSTVEILNAVNPKNTIISEYKDNGTCGFIAAKNPRNSHSREYNILNLMLLSITRYKTSELLKVFKEYMVTRNRVETFLMSNAKKIVEGKYDEKIEDKSVLFRFKDICSRGLEYASKNSTEGVFMKSLSFSISGLVANEKGSSLYRMTKVEL